MNPYSYAKHHVISRKRSVSYEANIKELTKTWKIEDWIKLKANNLPLLKKLAREGFFASHRPIIWIAICESKELSVERYKFLLSESSPYEEKIELDVGRTIQDQPRLQTKEGQKALFNILKAYSIFNPTVGYTQGLSFIASLLLLLVDEVHSFWMMVSILKKYWFHLSTSLYIASTESMHQFSVLFKKYLPQLFEHFDYHQINILHYWWPWFSTLFIKQFELPDVYRIWDVLLLEGPQYLFQLGLAKLKLMQEDLLALDFEDIILYLQKGSHDIKLQELIVVADTIEITPNELRKSMHNEGGSFRFR